MLFNGKNLTSIEENDLLGLIGVARENEAVDFKEFAYPSPPEADLPKDPKDRDRIKNDWKISFCTDVVSLANASGGWIICGMKEKSGIAYELSGLGNNFNVEREIARLEQCANSGLEPALSTGSLKFYPIQLKDETKSIVFIIRVYRSLRAPHRIKATSKFYIRRSGRNDEMNVDELRAAFNLSQGLVDQVKTFRRERAKAIAHDNHEDVPILLEPGPRIVLHVVPLTISDPASSIELKSFEFAVKTFDQNYLWQTLNSARFNFDGAFIPIHNAPSGRVNEYFQVFRNGSIEWVKVIDRGPISLLNLEVGVITNLRYSLGFSSWLRVEKPLVIMLSLLGAKGQVFIMGFSRPRENVNNGKETIQKNELLISDIVFDDQEQNLSKFMKPVFDIIWNIGGWQSAMSFDTDGKWIGSI